MSVAATPASQELRIGHAERDAATTELAEHYALGRIDYEEHTHRLDQIWAARTASELRAAFVDLPGAYYQPAPVGAAGWAGPWWPTPRTTSYAPRRDRTPQGGPWFTRLPGLLQVLLVLLVVALVAANPTVLLVAGGIWLLLRRRARG